MLRFCDETPQSLINHVFSIEITPADNSVKVTQLLPESDPDPMMIKNIQLFVFPDPTAIESRTFFTFVLGDTACEFSMGFVLYSNSYSAKCVMSNYYYPDLFRTLMSMSNGQMITQAKALMESQCRTSVTLKNEQFPLNGARQKQKLMEMIFNTFEPFDIWKIIVGMVQARHIFIVSSSAAVCARYAAALPLLIEPFRWDMNCIPVLPMKLKEATQVPVPTIIGLTRAEVLLEGRVGPCVIVNPEIRLVIDKPLLDAESQNKMKLVQLQIEFHKHVVGQLKLFDGCPGFPHKHMNKVIRKFIFEYLKVFLGQVLNKDMFIQGMSRLPEYLESSQVLQDLSNLDSVPPEVADRIEDWFDEMFKSKQPRSTQRLALSRTVSASDTNMLETKKKAVITQSLSNPGLSVVLESSPVAESSKLAGPTASQSVDAFDLLDFTGPTKEPTSPKPPQASDDLLDLFSAQPVQKAPTRTSSVSVFNMESMVPQEPAIKPNASADLLDFLGPVSPTPASPQQSPKPSKEQSALDQLIWLE